MSNKSQEKNGINNENTTEIHTSSDRITSNKSVNSAINNTIQNLEKLKELEGILDLKTNLEKINKIKEPLIEYIEENNKISQTYENENTMLHEIKEENSPFKLDDFIFEERATKMFSDYYNLKEYLLYPYFNVKKKKKKRTNIITLSYNKIDFYIGDKSNTSIKSELVSMYVLDDRKTFIANYQGIHMIFIIQKNKVKSVSVLSRTFDYSSEFEITGNKISIPFLNIHNDLIDIENKINQTKNTITSTNNEQEKLNAENNLKIYKEEYTDLKNKYSESNIITELNKQKKRRIKFIRKSWDNF